MKPEVIVRNGPNQYICKDGTLKDLASFLNGFKSPVMVTGYKSYEAFLEYTGKGAILQQQQDRFSTNKAAG